LEIADHERLERTMTFDDDRRMQDGDDQTPTPADGASPSDRDPAEAWGSLEPADRADVDRFELGIEDVPAISGDSPDVERSRVDGMPEGWLDGQEDSDAAIESGLDRLAVTNADDDPETSGVSHSSRVQIGTGQSGIASPSDVGSAILPPEERSVRSLGEERLDQGVSDQGISDQERLEEDSGTPSGTRPWTDDEPRFGDEKPADEWGDIVATMRDDVPSESVGFGAFVGGTEVVDPATADSYHGDSQGIGESQGDPIDVGALSAALPPFVPSGAIVTSGPRPTKAGGGLRQMVGVVIGGLLAIPVTLAILLFGFQRDPLHLTPKVPDGLRFLLPSRFRSAGIERRTDQMTTGPGRLTLDQISSPSATETPPAEPAPEPSTDPVPATQVSLEEEPAGVAPMPDPVPVDAAEIAAGGLPTSPKPQPIDEVEIVVDPVLVDVRNAPPEGGRESAGIDLAAVTAAIDAATNATDTLGEGTFGSDPAAREQALVGWYRALSLVALELAKVERAAIESGRPSSEFIDRFSGLRERLATDRHDDLEILGSMWLSSEKRPSDGAVVVATLEAVRPVGPWWGGRLSVGGEAPHGLSFLARSAPTAQPGETVIVVGVLGDPGTIWAVDIGTLPAAGKAAEEVVDPGSF
jgi:hypothetical protein